MDIPTSDIWKSWEYELPLTAVCASCHQSIGNASPTVMSLVDGGRHVNASAGVSSIEQ